MVAEAHITRWQTPVKPPREKAAFHLRIGATGMPPDLSPKLPPVQSEGESWGEVLAFAGIDGKGDVMGSEFLRRLVGECRVGPHPIVIVAPFGQQIARFAERGK